MHARKTNDIVCPSTLVFRLFVNTLNREALNPVVFNLSDEAEPE